MLNSDSGVRMGGAALVAAAAGFIGVFAYLAARFNYPEVLEAPAGAFTAFRVSDEGGMRLALLLAAVAAVSMMLGLLRWPSIQWELARAYAASGPDGRTVLAAIFDGLNRYLGNYIGEFVGELCLNAFFILSARAMFRGKILPRWVAWLGLACGTLGLIAMWRNVTDVVAPVAALNNAVLPLWMIAFGVGLIMFGNGRGRAQIGGLAAPLGR